MINVDLRRYGTDKEYKEFVNGYISGADIDEKTTVVSLDEHNNKFSKIKDEELTLECEFEKESIEKLMKMATLPEDIQKKIVDIYNYMATNRNGKIVLQFETGIKMICEIDETEWKNPPKIDLNEVLKGDK